MLIHAKTCMQTTCIAYSMRETEVWERENWKRDRVRDGKKKETEYLGRKRRKNDSEKRERREIN